MRQRVFVYGTLLRGDVNHHLLEGARRLGACSTRPCFTLFLVGAYPGLVRGGQTAILGEVYAVDAACLRRLDHLEEYPRLYDRQQIQTPYGRAWIYVYRGQLDGRPVIRSGDWRAFATEASSCRAEGIRALRDPKTHHRRQRPFQSRGVEALGPSSSAPPEPRFGSSNRQCDEESRCPKKVASPSI